MSSLPSCSNKLPVHLLSYKLKEACLGYVNKRSNLFITRPNVIECIAQTKKSFPKKKWNYCLQLFVSKFFLEYFLPRQSKLNQNQNKRFRYDL